MLRFSIASERAVQALVDRQRGDGSWRDFWLPGGSSDEWVTAYSGAALALVPLTSARRAARRAWSFLRARWPKRAGWGYSSSTPADADSTTWGLLLAERLGVHDDPAAAAAQTFLNATLRASGVSTYGADGAIRRFVGGPAAVSFAGWTQPHWCVSGAAAHLRCAGSALRAAIERSQSAAGSWPSYWWREDAYATALCATALQRYGCGDAAIAGAGRWAAARSSRESRPFALALLLEIHCAAGDAGRAQRCARSLKSAQRPDGSWRGSAWLRVPAPDVIDPAAVEGYARWWGLPERGRTVADCNFESLDQRSVFTTATVLAALTNAEVLAVP